MWVEIGWKIDNFFYCGLLVHYQALIKLLPLCWRWNPSHNCWPVVSHHLVLHYHQRPATLFFEMLPSSCNVRSTTGHAIFVFPGLIQTMLEQQTFLVEVGHVSDLLSYKSGSFSSYL